MTINEWLPNPAGSDAEGEWVELFNDAAEPVALSGWRIENGSGKTYALSKKTLLAGEYFLLTRQETKLPLRNANEELRLFDAQGALRSRAVFLGSVPEGKSIAKQGSLYVVAAPSPRAANATGRDGMISEEALFRGTVVHNELGPVSAAALAFAVGISLAIVFIFLLKSSNDLQELFFGRY